MRNETRQHSWRWWILALVGIAQLMVVADITIMNVALPSAQKALHFSNDSRQWVVTAYAMAFGSLLLVGGRLGDAFGRKRTLLGGLLGFAGASAVGGAASSFGILIAARALQGAFGALLAPSALGLLTTTFAAPRERRKAFGVYGAITVGGPAVGLLLGGVLTEYLSWRWCLYMNLAFAIPAAIVATVLLRNERAAVKPSIDLPGTITAFLGLAALGLGASNAELYGWGAGQTIGALSVGVVLIASFVALEARSEHPLLPRRVLLDRRRGTSYLAIFTAGIGMFSLFLFLTYYLQETLAFSPVQTGFAFLPMTGVIVVASTISNVVLLPRLGPRPLVTLGFALAAVGMVLLTRIGVDSTYASRVLAPLLIIGAGLGLGAAPAMNTATRGVARKDAGVASGLVSTMQQLGGSLGIALLSTFATDATTDYVHGKLPTPAVIGHATVHGYTVAFWIVAGVFAVGAVACALLYPSGVIQVEPSAEPATAQ